ncbi:XdhC family protein [Alcaligenaceae bacterium B3P038]|nr:XdhC family protein [Alcaligenaceae bacterium B3P038]
MYNTDLEVLKTAQEWVRQERAALLVTVVHTWGSSPRPVGSMMAIREDGHVRGSVSGGCIEDDLIAQMREGTLLQARPFTTKYGLTADEAHRFGLPCGGTLELVLEPLSQNAQLEPLIERLEDGELVQRTLDLETGAVALATGAVNGQTACTEGALVSFHGPRYRLIIIGAGQLSHYVARFAQALDYAVTVCDPRDEYMQEWDIPGVVCAREMPDDLILAAKLDARTAVVTLTHDPKLDDMALLEALNSPAFYVGAVGSRSNNAARRDRLKLFDLHDDQIGRLHGPIGLHLGARTPPEIALAIMAEMTACRNGVPILQTHAMRDEPAASAPAVNPATTMASAPAAATALAPLPATSPAQ